MLINVITPEIQELINSHDWKSLKEVLPGLEPVDTSDLIRSVSSTEDRVIIFRLLPRDLAADVFSEMDWDLQEDILSGMNNTQIRQILTELEPDDRTRFFEECPSEVTRKLIEFLPVDERKKTLELLGYPEYSVGRLMTPNYVAIKKNWTIKRSMEHIRKIGKNVENFDIVYVIDNQWKLLDAIELRSLILSDDDALVESIMDNTYVSLSAFEDQEKAVHYFEYYGLPILPVVDSEGVLLGSITFDDILEIAKEEATEDFHKTASVSPLETPYMQTKVLDFFKKRVGWLVALIFVNIISGFAMAHFEELIQAVTALVFFIPLIIDSGGNAGSQSSAMIIRAFATGEVHLKQWWEVVLKDLFVSMMLGLTMGLAVSLVGVYRGGFLMGISVALSMAAVVVTGSLLGTILPFILRVFKLDPATASSPLITSMADILGVIFFFSISQALIGL